MGSGESLSTVSCTSFGSCDSSLRACRLRKTRFYSPERRRLWRDVLTEAVRRNGGAAGVDGETRGHRGARGGPVGSTGDGT